MRPRRALSLCFAGALAAVAVVALRTVTGGGGPASAGAPPIGSELVRCDRVASPRGNDRAAGTAAAPWRSAARLAARLGPGETGCLRAGTYREDVTLTRAHATLRSYPGERATLAGRLWARRDATGASVVALDLDGRNRRRLPSPTVNAADVTFSGDDVTNHRTGICFLLGSPGWGRAIRTTIRGSRIHDCGRHPTNNMEHGIYVAEATGAKIMDNVIYDNAARGIQLYPDAQGTLIAGNIIDGNGEGIIFSGDGRTASSHNVVRNNIIANSRIRADIESWYPSPPRGTGNEVHDNCIFGGDGVDGAGGGFALRASVTQRPAYRDRAHRDFRLTSAAGCGSVLRTSVAPAGPGGEAPLPGAAG